MAEEEKASITALENAARAALAGNRSALDHLVRDLGRHRRLVLRMLCNRGDAKDATQEILIPTYYALIAVDFRRRLKTWAYRVAVNDILDEQECSGAFLHLSFEQFANDLISGISGEAASDTEQSLLLRRSRWDVHSECCNAWTVLTDSPTFVARSWSCQDQRRRTSVFLPIFSGNAFNMRGRRS